MGFVGHYRERLADYSELAGPLHSLIKSNAEWKWGTEQEDAFIELKHHIYLFLRHEVRKRQNDGKVNIDETPPPSEKTSPPKKIQLDDDYSEGEPPEVEFVKMVDDSTHADSRVRDRPRSPIPRPAEKAYRLLAPIQKPGRMKEVIDGIEAVTIPTTLGQLCSVAPEVARQLRKSLTKIRIPYNSAFSQESPYPFMEEEGPVHLEHDAINMELLPQVDSLYVATEEDFGIPDGSLIVSDPYTQYLATLAPNEAPKQVYVAHSSASLKAIHALIAGREHVECVIDDGSQIVSMSLEEAERALISWNPDYQIYMQSANGSLKKSAGLAKNVAFRFGDITVYLQVHIIDQPAYKVLLGRPFSILTATTVQNRTDGSQIITIKDPNTGSRCTMPTHNRGTFSNLRQPTRDTPTQETVDKRARVESVEDEDEPAQPRAPIGKGKEKENVENFNGQGF